ncbi:MAG: hypothetical protein OEV64_02415, partial [Desulfobulbaceae bacterium]|nr:hypothetical protein [Desulfobulbaceae bacterium]
MANGFIVFLMAIMIVYVFVIMSYLSKLEEESEIYKKGIDSILNLPEIEGEYKKYFSKVDYIYRGLASDIGQSAIVDSLSEMASSSGVTISKQSYRDINEGIRVGYEVDLKLTGDYFS